MLKEERQQRILDILNNTSIAKVSDIKEKIHVAEMTIRRDLKEMETKGLLIRIHGGAKVTPNAQNSKKINLVELSHLDKKSVNFSLKNEIAKIVAENINDGDTVFLGAGTTLELVYDHLKVNFARIITNSIFVFDKLKNDSRFEIILIGGRYRNNVGAFVGTIANDFVSTINVHKAFVGLNAISDNSIYNSNEEEGLTQAHILNCADIRYIVADSTKFDKRGFYKFYELKDANYLITDSSLQDTVFENYSKHIEILK